MEKIDLVVRGERASKMPSAIKGFPRNRRTSYSGDGFVVVVTEQYFLRTNSDLQTTTVIELLDETTCRVSIISGGGGAGLLSRDVGAESSETRNVLGKIETFCEENDLELERE